MIDYVKLLYKHDEIDHFIKEHQESIIDRVRFATGELINSCSFQFEHYKISIRRNPNQKTGYIEISGSFHKNHFDGDNYDRFTFNDLQSEIRKLCRVLSFEPERVIIQNLEVGVNIETSFSPYEYLNDNLLLYSTKTFKPYKKGSDGKELGYFCEGLPIVKIYDKGKQYDLPKNLLRFELRYKKSTKLHRLGIYSINDLMDVNKIKALGDLLLIAWENVLLYEVALDLKSSFLNADERQFYKSCEHSKNWKRWLKEMKSRNSFYQRKKRFMKLIQKHGKNVHQELVCLLRKEIEECTKLPGPEKVEMYKMTDTLNCNNVHSEAGEISETHQLCLTLKPNFSMRISNED